MDDFETTMIITALVLGGIGSLILAVLHGFGFNLFGFKSNKPGFWKRFVFQVASSVIAYGVYYLIGEILVSSENGGASAMVSVMEAGPVGMFLIIALVTSLIYHVSLGAATYLLGSKSINVAIKSPILCTAVVFVSMALPAIILMFNS